MQACVLPLITLQSRAEGRDRMHVAISCLFNIHTATLMWLSSSSVALGLLMNFIVD